jgi:aldehyde:ferredoxin oxidoreductase
MGKEFSVEEVVDGLLKEEEWRQVLSSLVVCYFARKVYTPALTLKALNALGIGDWTEDGLEELGRVIHRAKMNFKFREGFDLDNIRIPKRIFEVPTPHGFLKEEEIRAALEYYKKKIEGV